MQLDKLVWKGRQLALFQHHQCYERQWQNNATGQGAYATDLALGQLRGICSKHFFFLFSCLYLAYSSHIRVVNKVCCINLNRLEQDQIFKMENFSAIRLEHRAPVFLTLHKASCSSRKFMTPRSWHFIKPKAFDKLYFQKKFFREMVSSRRNLWWVDLILAVWNVWKKFFL